MKERLLTLILDPETPAFISAICSKVDVDVSATCIYLNGLVPQCKSPVIPPHVEICRELQPVVVPLDVRLQVEVQQLEVDAGVLTCRGQTARTHDVRRVQIRVVEGLDVTARARHLSLLCAVSADVGELASVVVRVFWKPSRHGQNL